MKSVSDLQTQAVRPLRIVAVDHEPFVLNALAVIFQRAFKDVELKAYTNWDKAWRELSQANVDCLITEFTMPGLKGGQMLQHLLDAKCKFRIIVMSAVERFEQTVLEFASRGLNVNFLPKPFTVKELRQAMGQPEKVDFTDARHANDTPSAEDQP